MKRGEEFGKPRKPPKPKPKPPGKGGPQQPTSYGEKAEERTTEPEAVTPTSPEEGLPQGGAGIHEEGLSPVSKTPGTWQIALGLSPVSKTLRPWQIALNYVSLLMLAGVVIFGCVFLYGLFSSMTSTPSSEEGVTPEEGVPPPLAVSNHWVSATPGKGYSQWEVTPYGKGYRQEGDVDLRIEGTTGSLTFTVTADSAPKEISVVGQKGTYAIQDVKDDGTTISFITKSEGGQVITTYQLARALNGHLIGLMHQPETGLKPWDGNMGGVMLEREGTLDLVPAP